MQLRIQPVQSIQGEMRPPSDKSLTHRAYMLGALGRGESVVRMPLTGEDCEATLRCLQQMGLRAARTGTEVRLTPAAEWNSPVGELDCGNSGTTMRLLAGLVASRPIGAVMTGDESLGQRPMRRIAEPLRLMGAQLEGDTPPLRIHGRSLTGITYDSPVASAQIKSCTLFAGLRAEGRTMVTEPALSRDHTERMLSSIGVPIEQGETSDGRPFSALVGPCEVAPLEMTVPGDISSAAFFMVAAAILPGSRLMLRELGVNPTRTGVLDVLTYAGAAPRMLREWSELGEPTANVEIEAPAGLKAFQIEGALVPRLIDEIPVLAVLATQCEGTTVIRDAGEMRVKESDRIELVAAGLRAMGAPVETFADGMAITGPCRLRGAHIDSQLDHRIAMAFAVAGLVAEGETVIEGAESIATSFPGFEAELRRLCS